MVRVTFTDFTVDEFPIGGKGSVIVYADPQSVLHEIRGWLDASMGEGSQMNWIRAVKTLKENLPADVKTQHVKTSRKYAGYEITVDLPTRYAELTYNEAPIESTEQVEKLTRLSEYKKPVVVS